MPRSEILTQRASEHYEGNRATLNPMSFAERQRALVWRVRGDKR